MYELGEHFKNKKPSKLVTMEKAVFRGSKYRISLLTERLIRLEYNEEGVFNNSETAIVKNRLFSYPEFSKKEDDHFLIIETPYFTLTYLKNAAFATRTLYATIDGKKMAWYYGMNEVRNLGGIFYSLDNTIKFPHLSKGLFAMNGVASFDDSDSMCFDVERNYVSNKFSKKYVDLYLFIYGKDFGLCLDDYYRLTGMPPLIPRYALGNWWSKEYPYKDKEIIELLDKFKRHNIPFSVFLLDNGWSQGDSKYPDIKTGFSFNKENFPHYAEFIKEIHNRKIKLGVKINPQYGFYPFEEQYENASKYVKPNNNGVIEFDPTNMKHIDVLLKLFIHPLQAKGIDIIWNDYNDIDINKIYLVNYYMHMDNRRLEKRNIILSRNSTYAPHLFDIIYSGKNLISWKVLKMLPFLNLTASNVGVGYLSHDVAGSLSGIEDSDFYLRSLQLGVFSPILRFNTEKGNYFKREPWKWDIVTESIASEYLILRHKLIPYLYSEAYNYHKFGKLLIKPFYYYNLAFYDDENYVNQYYFGSAFMISPIIKSMDDVINRTIQKFFIPDGVWYDFKNGKRFLGNHKYISFYSISDYPIFVKQGSIIPMAGENSFMSYENPNDFEIHVFPGASNTYHLYEDDGETKYYQNGKFCVTEFDYNYRKSNYTLIVRHLEGDTSLIPAYRNYKVVFRNTKKANNVVVNENDQARDDIKVEITDTDFVIYVDHVNSNNQLVINCYGEDIEIDSVKLIKDDIDSILSDLKINTLLKDDIAEIVYDDKLSLGKKRIAIKKLRKKGLDARSVKIFLKLLEYMEMDA